MKNKYKNDKNYHLTDFSCYIFENDITEVLNGHTIKVLAVREVNHRKKPGGDSGASIRGHMKYATKQFVRDEIKKSEQITKKFVGQKIKKSEVSTKAYIDKRINELDIKLSNKIDNLQFQIDKQEKKLEDQNNLLRKLTKHFNL